MIPYPTLHWNEILAAYADGEFEGRDELAPLKQRVEDWLAGHPDAAAELAEIRQLKQLWRETMPPQPAAAAWRRMLQDLQRTPPRTADRRRRWSRIVVGAIAAAACIALAVGSSLWQRPEPEPTRALPPIVEDTQSYRVAAAHEIEILTVEGADTHTLVVGELPLSGPLNLAALGDVTVTSVKPAAHDNAMPEVHWQGPGRPMIWARLDSD